MALLYGGPDQIMGVASGLATIVGVAMMFEQGLRHLRKNCK